MLKANGGLYDKSPDWGSYVVVDGKLVTGTLHRQKQPKKLVKLL